MKSKLVMFALSFCFLTLTSCTLKMSGTDRAKTTSKEAKEAEPGQLSLIKTPAKITESGAMERRKEDGVFFASIRILTDTKSLNCDAALARRERVLAEFVSPSKEQNAGALFNVELKSTGFDESSYQFTEIEKAGAVAAPQNPYGLKIRWRGATKIEVQFLDQVERIQLDATPFLSFPATEKRGSCTIEHQVNLFAEAWKIIQE